MVSCVYSFVVAGGSDKLQSRFGCPDRSPRGGIFERRRDLWPTFRLRRLFSTLMLFSVVPHISHRGSVLVYDARVF